MKIEDQVCSLELAREMKELGFEQDSLYSWIHPFGFKEGLKDFFDEDMLKWVVRSTITLAPFLILKTREKYAAYTVAELGIMLPSHFYSDYDEYDCEWACCSPWGFYEVEENGHLCESGRISAENNTEANARAMMLIKLHKEGFL